MGTNQAGLLNPQPQFPMEWWHIHGKFQPEGHPHLDFVISIFRSRLIPRDAGSDGYRLVLSVTDPLANRKWNLTRIDPSSPFTCDGLGIRMDGEGFHFAFVQPETGLDFSGSCRFHDSFEIAGRRGPEDGETRGVQGMAFTRTPINGTFHGARFAVTAWLDHLWSDPGWDFDPVDHPSIPGWNWYGISLDDGSEILVFRLFQAGNPSKNSDFALLRQGDGIILAGQIEITEIKEWFSFRTDAGIPVTRRLVIPEFDADLVVDPWVEDQEIPVPGPMRSVWQGGGRVNGSCNGVQVKGGARCELAGYSAITDLTDHFKRMCSRIDRSIESFFPKNPDSENLRNYLGAPYWAHEPVVVEEMISKPVWELMNRSGKRWRPLFTYYLLKALGMDPRPYEQAVFALSELIHTGSLIIDDIQDGSPLRRGEESIHLRYGQDVAITAGNTLYFLPSILIMDHPVLAGSQKHEILQIMNRQLIRAHIGQSMDLYWSRQYESNGSDPADDPLILDRILQMYALKTGAPIQGLAEMSAVIARMPPEVRAACGEFALSMGIAFQIVDDVRNLSAGEKTGKIAGEDLQDGKITYAMVACLKQVGSEERKFLTGLLKSREQRCDAGLIDRGLDIIRKSGGLERCRTLATVMLDQAWIGFEAHLSPSDSKTMLRWLAGSLINPAD